MLEKFFKYIESNKLFNLSDKILLTVSGGVDSVVMTDLFYRAGIKFGIVHCNFNLRGAESEDDEKFVKTLLEKHKVPFFLRKFNTKEYAKKNKLSVQLAARNLRYEWFNELIESSDYDYFATGHNLDDQIETFFINFFRGTGISGLHGILPKNGKCVRPLLFAEREKIEEYAGNRNLDYRLDSSNLSDKYFRNKIRHQLLPALKNIKPDTGKIFFDNFERIRGCEEIFKQKIAEEKSRIFILGPDRIRISIQELNKLKPVNIYLYEFLKPFNFNFSTVEQIVSSLNKTSGKWFYSPTHRLLKDRKYLMISETDRHDEFEFVEYEINLSDDFIRQPIKLNFSAQEYYSGFKIKKSPMVAQLDFNKLVFPLILRKWKYGDVFCPFGMKGSKKLSDYFTDKKISSLEKENIWLLLSENKIVWIVSYRIDNRFRIDNHTKRVFIIRAG